jgi:hypothetical protein
MRTAMRSLENKWYVVGGKGWGVRIKIRFYVLCLYVYPSLPISQCFAGGSTVSIGSVSVRVSTWSVDLRLLVSSEVPIVSGSASSSESMDKSWIQGPVRRGVYRLRGRGLPNSYQISSRC